eukprot:COSAG02_NODE_16357_length_1090_cov_1.249243_1_plen_52_part_00
MSAILHLHGRVNSLGLLVVLAALVLVVLALAAAAAAAAWSGEVCRLRTGGC